MEEQFHLTLLKKDEEIRRLSDENRGVKPITDQYRVLFAEKKELQLKFDAIVATYHALQQMVRDLQSQKTAADSRVKELRMVVDQVTAENETLTQQNATLEQQNEVYNALDCAVYVLGSAYVHSSSVISWWLCYLLLMHGFEGMFSGIKSKTEALELENAQLKEAICLPDLQVCVVWLLCW